MISESYVFDESVDMNSFDHTITYFGSGIGSQDSSVAVDDMSISIVGTVWGYVI